MRVLFVASLLLVGLLAVPSASAAPPCSNTPTHVGCWLAYGQETFNDAYDDVEDFINNPPWCFHPIVPEVPPLIRHC